MTPRARILAFGGAGAMTLAGIACGLLIGGLTGEVLAIALVTVGLGGALLLAFFEVGLSEDHEREREEARDRRRSQRRAAAIPRRRLPRPPRRPG